VTRPVSSLLSLSSPGPARREMSRSCHNIPVTGDRREQRVADIVKVKEWRRRHKTRGLRDKTRGFLWRRWNPDDIPHQRSPKPKLIVTENIPNNLGGECPESLKQDVSTQSLPLIEISPGRGEGDSLGRSEGSFSSKTDDDIFQTDNGIIVNLQSDIL